MTRLLNIACLQTEPCADFDSASRHALALAEEAISTGATLLLLPEYCGGLKTEGRAFKPPTAPIQSHPVLNDLRQFAATNKIWILVGSVAVPGPEGQIYNRQFVIDNYGEIQAQYDKLHLFDIQLSETKHYRESDFVAPGSQAVVVDMLGTRIGLSICYDLRFPTLHRQLAQAGAEILVVPAAFTRTTGEAHWHVLNRARAIENGAFVVSPCAVGEVFGGGASYGHSLIVNPWGEILAEGGESPEVISYAIDLDEVGRARQRIPSLTHDRAFTLCDSQGLAVA